MTEKVEALSIDLTEARSEAQSTTKTLKELREEVKSLRTTLENTQVGSEEFGATLVDLTKKQQELTNVTRSGIAAQKGSYNDLVNQMAILKQAWRSTSDEAERVAIGKQISDINTQLKDLDASIGNHQREVGNYRQALKGLKEELMSLEEGTEEYNKKIAEAAEISQKMQDVNEFISASAHDMGDHLQNAAGIAAGLVGAFQSVQAAMNLIGVEGEYVNEVIAKMQSLMAITQGLTALEGAIDKYKRLNQAIQQVNVVQTLFNNKKKDNIKTEAVETAAIVTNTAAHTQNATATTGAAVANEAAAVSAQAVTTSYSTATGAVSTFNAVMKANPLGVVIAAVTALVAGAAALARHLKEVRNASKDIAAMNDKFTESMNKQNRAIEKNIELTQAEGLSRQKALEKYADDYKRIAESAYENYSNAIAKASEKGKRRQPISKEEQDNINKSYDLYVEAVTKYNDILFDIEIESIRARTDARNKYEDELLASKERFEERYKELSDRLIVLSKDEMSGELYTLNLKYTEELAIWQNFRDKRLITQEQYNNIERVLELNHKADMDAITIKANAKAFKELKDSLAARTKEIKTSRDRIMRNIMAEEDAMNRVLNNIPVGLNAISRIEEQEYHYSKMIASYNKYLKLIEDQDKLERSYIQNQIKNLNKLREENGLLTDEQQEFYDSLLNQLASIGAEATNVAIKIQEMQSKFSDASTEKIIAYFDLAKSGIESFRDTFAELNDIGGAFTDEWVTFFDSMLTNIDNTTEALRNMRSVLQSNASDIDKAKAKWQGYGAMSAAVLNTTSSLMLAMSDAQDKESRKGFEASKNYQVASAVMNMLSGIVSAWASSMQLGPIAGPIAGAALSALITGIGIAQISQIKKTKFESGASSGSVGSSTSTSSSILPSLTAMQNTQISPNSTLINGASTESSIKDTRVYVVESDITDTQHSIKSTVSEATF